MNDDPLSTGDANAAAHATLTLMQFLIRRMLDKGELTKAELKRMIDNAVAQHLQHPAGSDQLNKEIAGALRTLGDRLLKS